MEGNDSFDNPHFIERNSRLPPEYRIVVCGDHDEFTGRQALLTKYGRDSKGSEQCAKVLNLRGRPTLVELVQVPPEWCNGPLLDHHINYSHGFVIVVNPASRRTLDAAKEMRRLMERAATAHGLMSSDKKSERWIPMALVANTNASLAHLEDESSSRDVPGGPELLGQVSSLAELWNCDYSEIDTSRATGAAVDDLIHGFATKMADHRISPSAGMSKVAKAPPPRFLMRRILGHLIPDSFLKSKN
ncbi:hypothetical protein GQ53DRAFT_748344 [Thozetella sp. PMI_491]|nr:hypothetical protein GQ53DRAFT_748344 [Thozetella sp. PMI_491]